MLWAQPRRLEKEAALEPRRVSQEAEEALLGAAVRRMTWRALPPRGDAPEPRQPFNTTIGVVATNVRLDKAQAQKLAGAGQTGMARAIRPVHTLFDGDTVFALSTAKRPVGEPRPYAVTQLGNAAADCVARAIARGVYEAQTLGEWRSYRECFAPGKDSR